METVKIGISACLLGRRVRYDGGHRWDPVLTEALGPHCEWVPVCPEVEYGLGVPREAMRLIGDPVRPRLVTIETGVDHAAGLKRWSEEKLAVLKDAGLCGFIFKSGSPSCGMAGVRVYDEAGTPRPEGIGIFARAFMERLSGIPVEDEVRLQDPVLRGQFMERVLRGGSVKSS